MIPPTSIDGTDITGATIDGTDVTEITVDGDVVFSPSLVEDGDFLYVHGEGGNFRYDAITPFDFSNNSTTQYDNNASPGIATVSPNGDTFILAGFNDLQEFSVSIPFDFSTKNLENTFPHNFGTDQLAVTIYGPNLDNMVVIDRGGTVEQFSLGSSFSLSNVSSVSTGTINASYGAFDSHFNDDGTKLYGSDLNVDVIQYNLSTPFDPTTVTSTNTFNTNVDDVGTVMVGDAGEKMYVQHHSPNDLEQYDLSTPFEVTSAVNKTTIDSDPAAKQGNHLYIHPAPHY